MNVIKRILLFLLLTLLTQVGGLVYVISHALYSIFKLNQLKGYKGTIRRLAFHVLIYLIFTFTVIPLIAGMFGRVPLPLFEKNNLGPRTIWTVLLNRHYVRPQLRETVFKISTEMGENHPEIRINYFDANHPFYKGYPLIPHLSHNDGKKLDLGFVYIEAGGGQLSDKTPSVIGYGISEEPREGEYNRPADCGKDPENWMYNFMHDIYPQGAKQDYSFDPEINKELINAFAKEKNIVKILLEPHLKTRLSLKSGKIVPVQCGSVRHDDHFHIQIN